MIWLARWEHEIRQRVAERPGLELGCGRGGDTAWLAGLKPGAFLSLDRSLDQLAYATEVPAANLMQGDLRDPLPFPDQSFDLVTAGLCLHYFPWSQTLEIAAEIDRVLRPGGWLIMRVNASDDVNFGAGRGVELEPSDGSAAAHYVEVEGRRKRFFDEPMVRALLDRFEVHHLKHTSTTRWERVKRVWEAVAIKPV